MAGEPVIIQIKRGAKVQPKAGGAWKVAFADFALAMMALFLVLWLVQVADQQERAAIVNALHGENILEGKDGSIHDSSRPHIIDLEGSTVLVDSVSPSRGTGSGHAGPATVNHIPRGERGAAAGQGDYLDSLVPGSFQSQAQLAVLGELVEDAIAGADLADNVTIEVVPQGLKILIRDNLKQFMFARGSARMTPYFEDLLLALAPVLSRVENPLMVSGHTDSTTFRSQNTTNWELSSQRALEARRALQYGGVGLGQFIQVVGMADQVPLVTDDPRSSANRRIELMVLTEAAQQELRNLFGSQTGQAVPEAAEAAQRNQPRGRYLGDE
ncbi:flagellar motor protein MotB [Ferrimonas marina]|uniref:Chemotaxis protein MotB n=1 Tax=Ferrimonas marina TaxID=299255 RepID=A0A1M5QT98_9GAMM|nr:flagellar motor protein MotB [Ferrimonas marina]SHH17357.1 chemotaxis protein MotB [Ferrimonas marina]